MTTLTSGTKPDNVIYILLQDILFSEDWNCYTGTSPVHVQDLKFIITLLAYVILPTSAMPFINSILTTKFDIDLLAPNGTRPSASTVLTEMFDMFPSKFTWLSMIPYHIWPPTNGFIKNCKQDLMESHCFSRIKKTPSYTSDRGLVLS